MSKLTSKGMISVLNDEPKIEKGVLVLEPRRLLILEERAPNFTTKK
ncbi:7250_t:CDS:2, partial [Cetraspora pellucida]